MRGVATAVVMALCLLAAGRAGAQPFHEGGGLMHVARTTHGTMSLSEAVNMVTHRTGGRVLSADRVRLPDGRMVYRIRVLLAKGRVRVYQVDPRTGEVR